MINLGGIEGLNVESRASYQDEASTPPRISLLTKKPTNIVFHGHSGRFQYDYYGIHRGTEDRLTFIGPSGKPIRAHFIDCREGSLSWAKSFETIFVPAITNILVIPPGVAHTFEGLDDIYTVNSYSNYLPDPVEWFTGIVDWSLSADIVNIPRGIEERDIPRIRCNRLKASETFYEITNRVLADQFEGVIHEYPLITRIKFEDDTSKLIKFQRITPSKSAAPEFEKIDGIRGLGWKRRIVVTGGDEVSGGFTILNGPNDFDVFERGSPNDKITCPPHREANWKRVTFLGKPTAIVKVQLETGEEGLDLSASPSPLKDLMIPPGVMYALSGLEGVVTVVKYE